MIFYDLSQNKITYFSLNKILKGQSQAVTYSDTNHSDKLAGFLIKRKGCTAHLFSTPCGYFQLHFSHSANGRLLSFAVFSRHLCYIFSALCSFVGKVLLVDVINTF